MEYFDSMVRLIGMDPATLPLYARILTGVIPVVVVAYVCYAIYVRVRGAVSAVRNLTRGIRAAQDPGMPADEVRAIAVGALYAYQQGGYTDRLDLDIDRMRLTTILSEWWGIDGADDAAGVINYLGQAPSSALLPVVCEAYKAADRKAAKEIIGRAAGDDGDIRDRLTDSVDNLGMAFDELVKDGIIASADDIPRLGVTAWDAGRLNFVARACMQKGYIGEADCRRCVARSYEMARSAGYGSWRDFARSYMLGRTLWSGNCDMTGLADDLLTKENSPWVRFPFES